jgi:hypothetical protein
LATAVKAVILVIVAASLAALAKTMSNHFFYLKKEMPWKTPTNCEVPYALQNKRPKRSGKKRQKVDGAEKAHDESKSDSPPAGA